MKTNKKGFTLVELTIIIALMGIVATIMGPRMINSTVFSNRTNKDTVLFLLRLGQKSAIAQRRDVHIISNNNSLSLCYVNTNPCPNNQSVLFQGKTYLTKISGNNFSIPSIKFNSKGNTDAGNINIKINNKDIYIEEENGYIHE